MTIKSTCLFTSENEKCCVTNAATLCGKSIEKKLNLLNLIVEGCLFRLYVHENCFPFIIFKMNLFIVLYNKEALLYLLG